MQHLFIDFDDTLSDFKSHTAQYAARLSANMAAEFGGDPAEWLAVLPPAIMSSIARYAERFKSNPLSGFCAWVPEERGRIAREVFQSVGRELPADFTPDELTLRIQTEALRECEGGAIYPGAREALHNLHRAGVRLHMASSHESRYLMAVMRGAGLDILFDSFFGADIIDCAKEGTEYYCRIFQACGIRPEQAVVVDDGIACLQWARQSGAQIIQARFGQEPPTPQFDITLSDWADLPAIIHSITKLLPLSP